MNSFYPHLQLMRFNRPIGTFLLLWPTLWALFLAGNGHPELRIVFIFVLGVIVMRSAGCVMNDLADRKWDGFVSRTQARPLVTGQVSVTAAKRWVVILVGIAFVLVLQTNLTTIFYAALALLLASVYPFTKRFTHLPQFVLGAAFAAAIPMAYTAQDTPLSLATLLLYVATIFWTVAFDTLYAMVDRKDDLKIGIKSTAILFGEWDKHCIAFFQFLTLASLIGVGLHLHLTTGYYLGLFVAAGLFIYQQRLIRSRDPEACFQAFLNNNWVGLSIWVGLFYHYYLL